MAFKPILHRVIMWNGATLLSENIYSSVCPACEGEQPES